MSSCGPGWGAGTADARGRHPRRGDRGDRGGLIAPTDENTELLRRAYEAWASGGVDALLEFVDPEIEWITAPQAPDPGPHYGHDSVRRGLAAYLESFDLFRPEVDDVLPTSRADELLVLATTHVRGKGSGAEISTPVAHLVRLLDGRIVRFQVFIDREQAIRDFT